MSHIINAVAVTAKDSNTFNILLGQGLKEGKKGVEERGYQLRNLTEEIQYQPIIANNNIVVYTALITWREKL